MNFEASSDVPNNETIIALAEYAKGLKESEGLAENEIRMAAAMALKKTGETNLDPKSAGSPDTELSDTLRKALEARHLLKGSPGDGTDAAAE